MTFEGMHYAEVRHVELGDLQVGKVVSISVDYSSLYRAPIITEMASPVYYRPHQSYSEWRRASGLQDTEYLRRAFEAGQRLGGRQ